MNHRTVFLIAALVCFGLKALGYPPVKLDLTATGLAFLCVALL